MSSIYSLNNIYNNNIVKEYKNLLKKKTSINFFFLLKIINDLLLEDKQSLKNKIGDKKKVILDIAVKFP